MTIHLVFLQEPESRSVSSSIEGAAVWAQEAPRAYTISIELPVGSTARFFDYLDGFISREMTACRRDGKIIYTPYAVSWDPVLRMQEWIREWVGVPMGATTP